MAPLYLLFIFTFFCCCPLLADADAVPLTLKLERVATNHSPQHAEVDIFRHRRKLPNHVVDFEAQPFHDGIYYTKVLLGSPPREFHLVIDTGSHVSWVSCDGCNSCPKTSSFPIQLNNFDPRSSSTSSAVLCSDQMCWDGSHSHDVACDNSSNHCSFKVNYVDGSGASGQYFSDLMHFFGCIEGSVPTDPSSPRVVFGCSDLRTGGFTVTEGALDGVLGLGNHDISVVSQLSSQGILPRVFSHCLIGDGGGGGLLVFGQIIKPSIAYSPLIPSQSHYTLDLKSISVNGVMLQIDPAIFATSSYRGALIDSGTTLSYLPEIVYNAFVDAITAAVPQSVRTVHSEFDHCYLRNTTSISDIFPQASFNFAGASLVLRPHDYFIQADAISDGPVWCIGFQKIQGQNMTIFGDLVLKDRIVVYDLVRQRIGFADHNCSIPFTVTTKVSKGRRSDARETWVMALLLTLILV